MYKPSTFSENEKRLGTIQRSICLENRMALRRRWRIACADLHDPREVGYWFPGQRYLFDILKTVDEETVDRLADCIYPLFCLKPMGLLKIESAPIEPETNPVDDGREAEVFSALVSRLDALRTTESEARICFALNSNDVKWIEPFCPSELRRISFNPSLKLHLAISENYFVAASTNVLSRRERGFLAVTSRTI